MPEVPLFPEGVAVALAEPLALGVGETVAFENGVGVTEVLATGVGVIVGFVDGVGLANGVAVGVGVGLLTMSRPRTSALVGFEL